MAVQQRASDTAWYESNLFWGPFGIGVAIVLLVVPVVTHHLGWLLGLAWPIFSGSIWGLARRTRETLIITVLGSTVAGLLLLLLGFRLKSAPTPPVVTSVSPSKPENLAPAKLNDPPPAVSKTTPKTVTSPSVHVRQRGKGNISNPGVIAAPLTPSGPCTVVQNGGSDNTASPTCIDQTRAKRYYCDGVALVRDPDGSAILSFSQVPELVTNYNAMAELSVAQSHELLLARCLKEQKDHVDWPTPWLFCALAQRGLGNKEQEQRYLDSYEREKHKLADIADNECERVASRLKADLGAN